MEGNPSTRAHILLVESDAPQAEHFRSLLASTGHQVTVASSGSEALESISSHAFDILLLDLSLDDMDGVRVLCRAKEARPESLVFILTGAPSIETAVEALRRGAYDYLLKPIQDDDLLHLVEKALRIRQLGEVRRRAAEDLESEKVRNIELRRDLQIRYSFSSILGKSPKMKQIHDLVLEVTRSDSTVLIQGESGTGKGLIARIIHYNSSRCDRSFVEANCAIYSEGVLQSELFGHEKGSFTGAVKQKRGRFELANGGTIFLDEIAEMSPATQLMLLRFLQERRFERVGGEETLEVDVRVLAATNKDLVQGMERGTFRNDLFYRLNVIPIFIPPLRERTEDIPLLASRFLEDCARKLGKSFHGFSEEAMQLLMGHSWPGNVREMENVIERSVVLAKGDVITLADLPSTLKTAAEEPSDMKLSLHENERLYILKTLAECNWNKKLTASVLGINRSSLYSKLKKHGIGAESNN
ncbi:MAG TPA: sigma-54 dependent transcriptional regulator [Candidatus Polarisedimenticolia bacterium]|nr:sigma-54 dependent transcriptional regulator [Candidatus Polarisedimenticolia bacterium]